LTPAGSAELELAALLHDVGKLGVPDNILNKPAALDVNEFQEMRHHAALSGEVISQLPGLARVAQLARWHHERVDGHGYPDGVSGIRLPLEARILATADVFQAMTQTRAYRPGIRKDSVRCAMHVLGDDGQLDPATVDAVDARFEDFWDLACHREGVAGLDPVLVELCRDGYPARAANRAVR
jgi:HD-GYP domain-containing protein (c-di-GMP phosphodiesterase class II)